MLEDADANDNEIRCVRLDVGGTRLHTSLQTLRQSGTSFPDSVLAEMFRGDAWLAERDSDDCVFVDADAELFRHILQVMRRPSLARYVPRGIAKEVWHEELRFWGLVAPSLSHVKGGATVTGADSVRELGHDIRRQIVANEETVVRLLLEESGYAAARNKTRHAVIYVPQDRYELPWTGDLARFLMVSTNMHAIKQTLRTALSPFSVEIKHYSSAKTTAYTFAGVAYNAPIDKTVVVDILFNDTEDL